MDGPNLDHSDSDSGESWTLLEDSPAYADEALDYCDGLPKQTADGVDNIEKDEDTDGISVITDSEPESISCGVTYETSTLEGDRPTDQQIHQFISVNPYPNNSNGQHIESMRSDDNDLLGDSSGKLKTYVHRRNKRLSTVLNIIVLGSVITAAGVAIGHMWGVRDDCSTHTTPSVNKILSNLYKLQEENAYLRNKLKELTLLNNLHVQQRITQSDKTSIKQPRCKKFFEEPLSNKNANKLTKCVDNDITITDKIGNQDVQPEYEKRFLHDVDKLKHVYMQNRSWLDETVARRLKNQKQQAVKDIKSFNIAQKDIRLKRQKRSVDTRALHNINIVPTDITSTIKEADIIDKNSAPEKKITYADSLRSDNDNETKQTVKKGNLESYETKRDYRKKRAKKSHEKPLEIALSEEEFKKDDRYMAPKHKQERKKYDRHSIHKKQKRKNKYEQWEIKSGYMKDFDDFSISSSQENDFILSHPDKNVLSRDFERSSYIDQFSEANDNMKGTQTAYSSITKETPTVKQNKKDKRKDKDWTWYEKRAVLRTEARKKLEQELFGETSPNTAGWYFRRMQKREQCRVRGDNSTHRKLSKRNMNFKLKH